MSLETKLIAITRAIATDIKSLFVSVGNLNTLKTEDSSDIVNAINELVEKPKPDYEKEEVGLGNVDNTSDSDKPVSTSQQDALDLKVDKDNDKQLSSEDYTTEEKGKLETIEENANNYIHPESHPASVITQDSGNRFVTDLEKASWNSKQPAGNYAIGGGSATGTNTGDETSTTIKTKLGITTISGTNTGDQVIPTTLPASDVYTWAKAATKPAYTKAEVGLGNVNNTSDLDKPISSEMQLSLNSKVDKVTGKQLSTEDFTTLEKSKLSTVEANANAYTHPTNHPANFIVQDANNRFFTDAEREKLAGIAANATGYTHPENHPPSIITQDSGNRFVTDAEKATWNSKQPAGNYAIGGGSATGTNTGDETASTIKTKLNITTLSGNNTGDQVIPTTLPASDVYTWAKAATKPTYTKAEVGLGNVDNTSDLDKPISSEVQLSLNSKVSKVTGKQLSTEDFTTSEKSKLSTVEENANAYTHPVNHPANFIVQDANNRFFTDTEREKLAGIAANATGYTHPTNHPSSIITQDANNRFVTDLEKASWNSKQPAGTYATGGGSATGDNTGDETTATIKTKLGVTTLTGSNTGDETTATIKTKLGVTIISGSNTGDQVIPTTLPASDVYAWAKATTKPTYSKLEVGLSDVDNTTDLNKPVSTLQQDALNNKLNKNDPSVGFVILDTRSEVSAPNNVPNRTGRFDFKYNTSVGNPPSPIHENYSHVLTINGWTADGTGGWPTQLSFGKKLASRNGNSTTTWGPWKYFLDSTDTNPTGLSILSSSSGAEVRNIINAPSTNGDNATGNWPINVTGNANTANRLNTPVTINDVSFNGAQNIRTSEWYHSSRDFTLGTLIKTGIEYQSQGAPFILEIKGNSYGSLIPFDLQLQGYIYNDTIINYGGYYNGALIGTITAMNIDGFLCFWFASGGYWQGFNARVYTAYPGVNTNQIVSITNVAKPAGTKQVSYTLIKVLNSNDVYAWAKASTKPTYTKAEVGLGNVDNTSDTDKPVSTLQQAAIDSKVDKVTGKQLSTEDFTTVEKSKLSTVEANANAYTHPANHPPSIITQDINNRFVTDAEKATWNSKQPAGNYAIGGGSATGTNTGDETSTTIKTKLGITTLTGSNSGDETASTIKTKLGITTISGSNTGDQAIPTSLPASDVYAWAKAATKPTYTKAEVGLGNVDNTADSNKNVNSAQRSSGLLIDNALTYGREGLQFAQISGVYGNSPTLTQGPTSEWWHLIRMNHANGTGYYSDIAVSMVDNSGLYRRVISAGTQLSPWVQILDSTNIANYAPSTGGVGATGSWPININGNANTVNDGLYKYSELLVNSSTSPITVDATGGSGIGYTLSNQLQQTDGALYFNSYNDSWQHQIYGDYRTGQITLRGKSNNSWTAWRTVIDSLNYTIYTPSLTGAGASGNWNINALGSSKSVSVTDGSRDANAIKPNTTIHALRCDFVNAATTETGQLYSAVMTVTPYDGTTAGTGGNSYQVAYGSTATNLPVIKIRSGIDTTWNSWYELVTSTSLKTINGVSVIGSGDIVIQSGETSFFTAF